MTEEGKIPDAVSAAPDLYKVVEENDRVRILEFRGSPGTKTVMHSHPAVIAVAITNSQVKFTMPDGQNFEIDLQSGMAMDVPGRFGPRY